MLFMPKSRAEQTAHDTQARAPATSVHSFLDLLHEGVHTLAGCGCCSFLQLQVKHASQLEGPTLLQLLCGHTHDALNNTFHILALQPCCLCHCVIGSCGCHC